MRAALFILHKNLGDSVILTAAINSLVGEWVVDVCCFDDSYEVFKNHPRVKSIIVAQRHDRGLSRIFSKARQFLFLLGRRYDIVASFSGDIRGLILGRLVRCNVRLNGPFSRHKKLAVRLGYFHPRVATYHRHISDTNIDLLRSQESIIVNPRARYSLMSTPDDQEKVREFLSKLTIASGHFILVHAASRWSFKSLPVDSWVQLIGLIQERLSLPVILSGGPGDWKINRAIASGCNHSVSFPTDFSITSSCELVRAARALICVDSAMLHISEVTDTPTLAIFGPTGELNWGPRKRDSLVVNSNTFPCRPCGLDGCGGSKVSDCLVSLDPLSVFGGLKQLLGLESKHEQDFQ